MCLSPRLCFYTMSNGDEVNDKLAITVYYRCNCLKMETHTFLNQCDPVIEYFLWLLIG